MASHQATIDFEPIGRRINSLEGETILETAQRAGIGLVAICGGAGTCGRCVVQLRAGELTPSTSDEIRKLTHVQRDQGYRLACQCRPLSNVRLHVPPASLTATQRAQIEGRETQFEFEPAVQIITVSIPKPTLEDPRADTRRILETAGQVLGSSIEGGIDFSLLRSLSPTLRASEWNVKVVFRDMCCGQELIAVLPVDQTPLGLAIDLGTTKVAGYLVNMETGETLQAKGVMNPQISYGEDVMARISLAMESEEKAETLRRVAVQGICELASDMCKAAGVSTNQIVESVIVGNTAMHHLILGFPVEQLGTSPYVAAVSERLDIKARDVGFNFAPGAYVHLLPNIAGFVGADHVAMLLSTGIGDAPEDEVWVGLDIGTNTEIGLAARGRILTCSTASGPAFEGAHIRYGMRAAPGAIEAIKLEGESLQISTIDNEPAVGICGSGILDAVGELYKAGILNNRGAMQDGKNVRPASDSRGKEFLLVPAAESGLGEDITVSRGDVSEVQLAKGAMRAGLNILLAEAGLTPGDITRFIIAGAFGSYIDLESGVTIGMLPDIPRERFSQVGNAAGIGAKQALLSKTLRQRATDIARKAEYIELTVNNRFTSEFSSTILLGT